MTVGFAHFRGLRVAQSRAVSEGQWAEAAPQGAEETTAKQRSRSDFSGVADGERLAADQLSCFQSLLSGIRTKAMFGANCKDGKAPWEGALGGRQAWLGMAVCRPTLKQVTSQLCFLVCSKKKKKWQNRLLMNLG